MDAHVVGREQAADYKKGSKRKWARSSYDYKVYIVKKSDVCDVCIEVEK